MRSLNLFRNSWFSILLLVCGVGYSQQKRIYIAPDDHTDYLWSGNEEQYSKAIPGMLDYYMRLNDSTAKEPYPYQFKWNCDGSYWVYIYRQNRSREQFEKLIGQIRSGRITIPLNSLVGFNGVAPLEATLRSMYFAGSLEREYGLNLELAMSMEDQVMPLGLASLWAGSGAKYSWHGVCNCATKVKSLDSRPHELYWYTGLDGQRVLMKWYSLGSLENKELGGYAEAFDPGKSIRLCLDLMNTKKYPYDVAGAFGMGWDNLATMSGKFIPAARNNSGPAVQVMVSNEIDFFRDVEKKYGSILPSETVSYGTSEWGINLASLAAVSADFKRSIEKLRTAEALSTYVSLKDNGFCRDLAVKKERAWMACGLYVEHGWTSDGPVITRHERADWQRKIAADLSTYVDTLYERSLNALGSRIKRSEKTGEEFFVFNPLGWVRTDYCDYPYAGVSNICVVDESTGEEVPFQIISWGEKQRLRILASDLPPAGYKVYEIRPGVACSKNMAITRTGNSMENNYYRITLDGRGSLVSIIDKMHGDRELVKPVHGLYMNDLGAGTGSPSGALAMENAGAVSATLVSGSDFPVKHVTKVTLFGGINRVEIEDIILQNFKQTLGYAYSFNMDKPKIWHEEAGAILLARPLSSGGHYNEAPSRFDWLGLNHFAAISDSNSGVILSNRDAFFMKTGNSRTDSLDFTTPQISVLAGGQIDEDINLGIPNQDGDSCFENEFAIRSFEGEFNAPQSMKFSMEHQNPPVAGRISGTSGYPSGKFSLLDISDPGVLLWSLKPAEEGTQAGIIVRVWNLENSNRDLIISSPLAIREGKKITHIETDQDPLKIEKGKVITQVGHDRIQSYRIFLKE
jgi:alpha-mannosidase